MLTFLLTAKAMHWNLMSFRGCQQIQIDLFSIFMKWYCSVCLLQVLMEYMQDDTLKEQNAEN